MCIKVNVMVVLKISLKKPNSTTQLWKLSRWTRDSLQTENPCFTFKFNLYFSLYIRGYSLQRALVWRHFPAKISQESVFLRLCMIFSAISQSLSVLIFKRTSTSSVMIAPVGIFSSLILAPFMMLTPETA